ncbi:RluA family pseudouridine synthase [Bhargavaea ullalensis]|uniref:Pseudouridine synthase n=1 Tax=Bhargavaea ullalensis TaxID=1265685 RepID=A0ABV2GDW6_9BACL
MAFLFDYRIHEDGMTVDRLLREKWQLGRKLVHELRMDGFAGLENGERVRWNEALEAGTLLTMRLPEGKSEYVPEEGELGIAYEDDHCLVVHKPAGMAVHPNEPGGTGTLMNRVLAESLRDGRPYAEHVHRLDQGTSGLVLIARHPVAKAVFDRMLEEKAVRREYIAETSGNLRRPSGKIDAPIGRDRHHATRRRVSPGGQSAVTHYEVIKEGRRTSLISVELDTGRTHQIRVHLAHLGHPIIGDTLYGGRPAAGGYRLHAGRIAFTHPFTEEPLQIDDPVRPVWLGGSRGES